MSKSAIQRLDEYVETWHSRQDPINIPLLRGIVAELKGEQSMEFTGIQQHIVPPQPSMHKSQQTYYLERITELQIKRDCMQFEIDLLREQITTLMNQRLRSEH